MICLNASKVLKRNMHPPNFLYMSIFENIFKFYGFINEHVFSSSFEHILNLQSPSK